MEKIPNISPTYTGQKVSVYLIKLNLFNDFFIKCLENCARAKQQTKCAQRTTQETTGRYAILNSQTSRIISPRNEKILKSLVIFN